MGAARRGHHAVAGRHPPRGVGLRQVWKAPTSPYLKPGGGLRWRVTGEGDRLTPLLPSADTRRKAGALRSSSAPSRYVTRLGEETERPPRGTGDLRAGPAPLSSLWGSLLPWKFGLCFVLAGKGCLGGIGWPGEESGLWDIGGGHEAWEGVVHPRSRKGRSSPPDNLRLFLAAQGIRG